MTEKVAFINRNRDRIKQDEQEIKDLEEKALQDKEKPEDKLEPDLESGVSDENLSSEEKTFKKRYGDLRRHTNKLQNELKEIKDLVEELKSSPKQEVIPQTDEEVKEWVDKYPQVARVVQALANETVEKRQKHLDKRFEDTEKGFTELKAERAYNELLKRHPDFEDIKDTPDFFDWLESKPKSYTEVLEEGLDVDAASEVITFYKAVKGIKPKNTKKEAAKTVKSGSGGPETEQKTRWSESKVASLSMEDYVKYEKEILAAMNNNTFDYDQTGGAR